VVEYELPTVPSGSWELVTVGAEELATVTVAVSFFEGFAALVARTWKVPELPGAVYFPDASTCPPPLSCTDHITAVDSPAAAPVTLALNVALPPGAMVAVCGAIETEMFPLAPPAPGVLGSHAVSRTARARPTTAIVRRRISSSRSTGRGWARDLQENCGHCEK
jgi:hypothetical protein